MRGFDKLKAAIAGSLIAAVGLYLLGAGFVLVAVCLIAGVYVLPVVPAMRSLVGRLFLSVLLFFAVFQAAATVQFLVWPRSDFRVAAALAAAVDLGAVLWADVRPLGIRDRTSELVNRSDGAGAVIAVMFLLPFAPILLGDETVARVAQIGGGQASDGATHFYMVADMMRHQHLNYADSAYYPQGFHITVAFLQDALHISQTSAGWHQVVFVFIGQYLVVGALLAGAIGYFLSSVLAALTEHRAVRDGGLLLYAASVATGVVVSLFVLLPFVSNGFLNYYYALATILVALSVLLDASEQRLVRAVSLYLVFIFGAGLSWPLLLPPLLASLVVFASRGSHARSLLGAPKLQMAGMAALVAMQFVPVAFQLLYSDKGATQNINATGNLRVFHSLSLLLSVLIVVGVLLDRHVRREGKERSVAIMLPLLGFTGALALMQLFMVGELRYYVIKVAFLLETLNIVFLAALTAALLTRVDMGGLVRFTTAAVVPVAIVLSLFTVTADPLVDVRNLFRTAADQVKPAFFDADLAVYAALGNEGEVRDFNSTVLHYDSANDRYSAHMQIPFWANVMQYDASPGDFRAMLCHIDLYKMLASGAPTAAEQAELVAGVEECARLAADQGGEYVIVTDQASADQLRAEFGDVARIESHAG